MNHSMSLAKVSMIISLFLCSMISLTLPPYLHVPLSLFSLSSLSSFLPSLPSSLLLSLFLTLSLPPHPNSSFPLASLHSFFSLSANSSHFSPSTWPGPQWTASQNLLSVLVSIQSLMNDKPFHNEPGFEKELIPGDVENYNNLIYHETLRVAVCDPLERKSAPPELL